MPPPNRFPPAAVLLALCAWCGGCGGLLGSGEEAPGVRVVSFGGWGDCLRLSNGLVRVTCVPAVGGRTLDYRLGGCNFLFIGRRELGTTADEQRPYRHFGGHFVQLHPEERWRRLQAVYPASLFMGRYEARIAETEGPFAVEMVSPPDPASGTRVLRRIELFSGSTRLRTTDTLVNARPVAQAWGLHDFLQLKGVAEPSGILDGDEQPSGEMELYVPLDPEGRYPGGLKHAVPPADDDRQWDTEGLPGLLVLRYRGHFGKAKVDPAAPWVALVSRESGHVFVQRCAVPEKAVLTAGGGYPLVEVESFAPVTELAPRGQATLVQEWFATRCGGPVVDVTDAGVVVAPLTLLRGEDGLWAAGKFGVFYVGEAAVVLRDAEGGELARFPAGAVHPAQPLLLHRRFELPPATARVTLEVRDANGEVVGDLGTVLLGGGVEE
ncbi:MAG: hypothetical protein ACODAJ_12415 [Planctomycetota bacterium]